MMDTLARYGHIPITVLLLAIIHGIRFRFYIYRNGSGRPRLRYGVYLSGKKGEE